MAQVQKAKNEAKEPLVIQELTVLGKKISHNEAERLYYELERVLQITTKCYSKWPDNDKQYTPQWYKWPCGLDSERPIVITDSRSDGYTSDIDSCKVPSGGL